LETRKAGAARVLGDKDECVKNLSTPYEQVTSIYRLTQMSKTDPQRDNPYAFRFSPTFRRKVDGKAAKMC